MICCNSRRSTFPTKPTIDSFLIIKPFRNDGLQHYSHPSNFFGNPFWALAVPSLAPLSGLRSIFLTDFFPPKCFKGREADCGDWSVVCTGAKTGSGPRSTGPTVEAVGR